MKVVMFEFDRGPFRGSPLRTMAVVAALLSSCAPARAQATRSVGHLETVREVLEGAFPDLVGSDTPTRVALDTRFNDEWLLTTHITIRVVGKSRSGVNPSGSRPEDEPFLYGDFLFDRNGLELSLEGQRVNSSEMETFTQQVRTHPDWTELQLAAALEAIGARYGPDKRESFARTLRLEKFANSLGRIRSSNIAFRWRLGRPELGADDIATPNWVVKVAAISPARQTQCYVLFFEPIGGSLTSIISDHCQ
jgi:hypothetical protein